MTAARFSRAAPADRDAIRNAWLDNLVLRFRGQKMTDAQHMAFTRQFGELEFNPAKLIEMKYGVSTQTEGRKSEIPPEISVISNILENGQAIGGLGLARETTSINRSLALLRAT